MNAVTAWAAASLLNALWQTALIFSAAWIAARLLRPFGARAEHRLWVGALLLQVALPFCRLHPEIWLRHLLAVFKGTDVGAVSFRIEEVSTAGAARSWLPDWAQMALAALFVLALAGAVLRLLWNLLQTRRLVQQAEPMQAAGALRQLLESSALELGVDLNRVSLARGADLQGPATVGLWRHILLLPSELIERGLTDGQEGREELATALAHELVHIRRRDFARNLFCEVIALPLAWHPLLMLTRVQVNETRELAVDAAAADLLAGNRIYARSLVRIAARMAVNSAPRAIVAMGIYDTNIFERRIMNLMRKTEKISLGRGMVAVGGCLLLALASCYTAMALQADVKPAAEAKNGVATLSAAEAAQHLVSKVAPKYPPEAKKAGIAGTVVLNGVIGTDGHIEKLEVISGPAPLAEAALDAVRQWVYEPYLLDGKPVKVETKIQVIYTLGGKPAESVPSQPSQKTAAEQTQPVLMHSVDPAYPPTASAAHIEGVVLVKTKIDADGHTTILDATGPALLQQAATAAVEKYTFRPATKNGQPVEAMVTIEVTFKLYTKEPVAKGVALLNLGPARVESMGSMR